MESATGGRMHFMFCRAGGLKDDLPRGFLAESHELVGYVRKKLREFEDLVMGNEIILARTKGIGMMTPDVGHAYGCSGPVLHATGSAMDPRKDEPYLKYDEVDFQIPVGMQGDSYDRLWCLVQRAYESLKIIEQCHDKLPPGPYVTPKVKPNPKLPEGEVYVRTENPLGLMSYYLVGDGTEYPYRLKLRTASFSNVSVLPHVLPGAMVADLISILGSIFFVVGDVDR
jgi:NADH-quinone oxidoreductase subunit D